MSSFCLTKQQTTTKQQTNLNEIMRTFCKKTIASIALALLGTGLAWAQTPVGLYTCDESSGATVANTGSLGTSKNATASGTYSRSAGKVGAYALTLSGTGCATVSGAVVNTASSYTVAGWVKLNSLSVYSGILSLRRRQRQRLLSGIQQ